ncbi:four and a half LIM domains protein 3 isoform X3 [Pieris napi]|uniref:four and a half LIM domains protein 3 isoform X3 n=1 Tax=Pieris napi TaxID=78633 RepID=UPI001FBB0D65|nr:four and a half LIM domains protein 3 isoform X3 [Pieris napi]
MGLLLSVILTYAGFNEAVECIRHILSGIVPEAEPNFQDLVEYYTRLLRKAANRDWTIECGQGYLHLTENNDGCIKTAAVKFYGDKTNSTALLFSTKISSFGQDSIEDNRANGDYKPERYSTKTKTIISQAAESFSVGSKKVSPTSSETVSDTNDSEDKNHNGEDNKDKLTWEYIPKSTSPLPEINFQSHDGDKIEDVAYTENYLRSRSRSKEKFNSVDETSNNRSEERLEVKHQSLPRLGSFEEKDEIKETTEDSELIFSSEYTKAMNKDWHSGHFCCWQCDESLTGQRYVLRDEHPFCIKCYESAFANGCEECNKTIGIDSKDLSYKDKHWHEACFLCAKCRVSLVDKQFGSKHDKIYCGNCYDAQFASRCDGCGEVFRAGTKKMEYKTRQWHEKCFCCVVCKNPIGTKSFIPREQEIYCAGCYEDKFATRCVKCNKIITQGGVTYKNEPWHRECFTCTNCDNSLAGQRFTSKDEKPYCAECFGELFAKRCTSCTKPITGIGGTRFISFEDRHWHNDCFICAQCKTSLVGKGFITDGPDIICPECAKQKLM